MKRLLLILMFLLPALAFGQKHAYFGTPTTIDSFNLTMWVRQFKMPGVPLVNPYFDSVGSVYLNTTTGTIYFHDGNGWQPIAGGSGGGGLQHAGPWLTVANDTVYFDTVRRLDYVLEDTDLKIPTAKAVRTALADSASDLRQVIEDTSLNLRAVFAADLADSMTVARDSVVKRVPYNGADNNLNMGSYGVTAKRANLDTLEPNSSAGLHLHNTSHQDIFIAGAGGGQNLTIYAPTSFSLMANQSETDTVLGSTSSGLVKKIGIATTYLKKSDSSLYATQYRVDTTAFNALTRINTKGTVSSVALANGFGLSISGSPVTGTGTITATVDTTKVATKADVNAKGSGTVTSIQLVAGTGVLITPTTAVTTSGVYTVTPEVSSATYNTLTNKRIPCRTGGAASYTTSVTIASDSVDMFVITAQAGALLFNQPSGTPTQGQMLLIRIKDNGTARALTWNSVFRSGTDVTLPTTTTISKTLYMEFLYNTTDSKWDIVGKADGY